LLKSLVAEVPDRQLSFVGLDKLSDHEKVSIQDLFTELYDKLLVHERFELKVHVKTYHDEGTQQKVSVHLHGQTVHGDKLEATADEWGLETAARSAMDKLEWQLRKLSDGAK
jgi:ribosome-associated translation inhibitor RaiA